MSAKFHINKHGVPAPCKARAGNCPLGGDENHFKTRKEAQLRANELNESEFGLLPNDERSTFRNVNNSSDEKYVNDRFRVLRARDEQKKRSSGGQKGNYTGRCRSSERIPNYNVNDGETSHYRNDRSAKERRLIRDFGEGEVIGYYKVNHVVKKENNRDIYGDQVIEIRDNGKITVYDYHDGRKVTTFMAHEERVEVMMLHSGQIPSDTFLQDVKNNFRAESNRQAAIRQQQLRQLAN